MPIVNRGRVDLAFKPGQTAGTWAARNFVYTGTMDKAVARARAKVQDLMTTGIAADMIDILWTSISSDDVRIYVFPRSKDKPDHLASGYGVSHMAGYKVLLEDILKFLELSPSQAIALADRTIREVSVMQSSSPVHIRQARVPEILTKVERPLPQVVKRDRQGRMYARWAMAYALADKLLDWARERRLPVRLTREVRRELENYFAQSFGFNNVGDEETGIEVTDLFTYLEGVGLVKKQADGAYDLSADRETVAIWARLNVKIEEQLTGYFNKEGQINDEQGLLAVIERYEEEAQKNPASLVEPRQAFLRAVLGLRSDMRMNLVNLMRRKYFESEDAPMTGGTMIDSILLTLRGIKDLVKWAKNVYPRLTREGRAIYLVAPEITLLAGGLGRVMQYLGRALKHMGINVVFVEPRYLYKVNKKTQVEEPLDYGALNIPLEIPDEPAFTYTVTVQGQQEEVLAYRSVNDEGIPVYTFRDKRNFYIQVLYLYGDGTIHPTAFQVTEFITKASLGLIDHLEREKKEGLEEEGGTWQAPVIALNDGQAVMAAGWRLFNPEFQTEILLKAHYMVTNHTYRNRIYGHYRNELLASGVPEGWLWLFKRKMPWNSNDNEVYDLTSGGMRAVMWFGGFANAVSEAHANEVRRFDPQTGGISFTGHQR